jgi:hypothetical protein
LFGARLTADAGGRLEQAGSFGGGAGDGGGIGGGLQFIGNGQELADVISL